MLIVRVLLIGCFLCSIGCSMQPPRENDTQDTTAGIDESILWELKLKRGTGKKYKLPESFQAEVRGEEFCLDTDGYSYSSQTIVIGTKSYSIRSSDIQEMKLKE